MMSLSCTISQCEQTMANGIAGAKEGKYRLLRGERGSPKNRSQEWRFYELQTLSISPFSGRRLDSKRPTTSNTMHFSSAATHANATLALSLKNFYSTMYCFVSPQ